MDDDNHARLTDYGVSVNPAFGDISEINGYKKWWLSPEVIDLGLFATSGELTFASDIFAFALMCVQVSHSMHLSFCIIDAFSWLRYTLPGPCLCTSLPTKEWILFSQGGALIVLKPGLALRWTIIFGRWCNSAGHTIQTTGQTRLLS